MLATPNATIAEAPQVMANRKIEDMKVARQSLLEAKNIMYRIDQPISIKIGAVIQELEAGLSRLLLARELNS